MHKVHIKLYGESGNRFGKNKIKRHYFRFKKDRKKKLMWKFVELANVASYYEANRKSKALVLS